MSELFVKICGLTRREDVEVALGAGADALGFILWPGSRRAVTPAHVASIARDVPAGVLTVGVFVDASLDEIRAARDVAGLRAVQLHGSEPVSYAGALGGRVLRALGVEADGEFDAWPADVLMVVDAIDPVSRGGTGTTIDWTRAARMARRRRTLLAGGLTPANVAEAVTTVRPYGVDVASGVEQAPGVKDAARVRDFVAAARAAAGTGIMGSRKGENA